MSMYGYARAAANDKTAKTVSCIIYKQKVALLGIEREREREREKERERRGVCVGGIKGINSFKSPIC